MKINNVTDSGDFYLIYTDGYCIAQRKGPSTASGTPLTSYEEIVCAFCEREIEASKKSYEEKPVKYRFSMGTDICAVCKYCRKNGSFKHGWCSHNPAPDGVDAFRLVNLCGWCGYFEARENRK